MQIVSIKQAKCLRVGDTAEVLFKLMNSAELINRGDRVILREGATKAIGTIVQVYPMTTAVEDIIADL